MKRPLLILALLIVVALAARISYVRLTTHETKGVPPVDRITIRGNYVKVYPAGDVQTGEMIDLHWFGDFKPRITLQEAVNLFGNPDNIKRRDKDVTIYEYWVSQGRIEVWEMRYEEGIDRNLVFYPQNMQYDQLLIPQIARHIDPGREKTGVSILNTKGQLQAYVWIIGNRVDSFSWDARWY